MSKRLTISRMKPRIGSRSENSSRPTHTVPIVRDAKGQMALFAADTHFVVYMDAKDPSPSQELHSREALATVFADLNQYAATTHFIGQSTIFTLTGDRATGEAYCLRITSRSTVENDA